MHRLLSFGLAAIVLVLASCGETKEDPIQDLTYHYQPLEIGNFWIYSVDETIYFGENDSEENQYFLRDRIRTSYLNVEDELVYIVERSTSSDQSSWVKNLEYTLQVKKQSLIRTIENQSLVTLVFPPKVGQIWNGKIYQGEGEDDFEIASIQGEVLRVDQEEMDDEVTFRDVRFEVFTKEVGLSEKYDEVITYCSRNDCLGDKLIDGGYKRHLLLETYGKN